jgi:hypothetical protein
MKNIVKILFATVLSVSIFASANAGEMTVTGSAKATYNITSSNGTLGRKLGQPALGMSNELAFNANGEFGNGYTWKYQMEMDPQSGNTGVAINDDTRLELSTPYGMFGIYGSEGDLNTHLKSSAAAYSAGHDIGTTGAYQGGTGINSYNNIQYHTPAGLLPLDAVAKIAFSNGDNARGDANDAGSREVKDVNSYQLLASPRDNVDVGFSYLEKTDSGSAHNQKYETGGGFVKFTPRDRITIGLSRHFVAPNQEGVLAAGSTKTTAGYVAGTANTAVYTAKGNGGSATTTAKYFENDALSVGVVVNDNLSVSFDRLVSTAEKRALVAGTAADTDISTDLTIDTLQAAYNIGGAVVSLSRKSVEGVNYQDTNDVQETIIALAMEF